MTARPRTRGRVLDLRSVVADPALFVDIASETLGVTRRSAERWLVNGVNWERADSIAVKVFGKHPMDLWGADWAELADDYSLPRAEREERAERRTAVAA
jgi:hypothetical protein